MCIITACVGSGSSDYNNCSASTGYCSSSDHVCCVGPDDALTGQTTCRLANDCVAPTVSTSAPVVSVPIVADWNPCNPATDTCSSVNSAVCCVATADLGSGAHSCRPWAQGNCGAIVFHLLIISYINKKKMTHAFFAS